MKLFVITALLVLISALQSFGQTAVAPCPYNYVMASPVTASTQIINGQGGYTWQVCKVIFNVVQGATAYNFSLVAGTGSVCATNQVPLTIVFTGVANSTQVYSVAAGYPGVWSALSRNMNICVILSGAPTSATVQIQYGRY